MRAHAFVTLAKELRETLRDRRTLAVMVLFPLVVYPLLSLLLGQVLFSREQQKEARASHVAIVGAGATADDLRKRVRDLPKLFTLTEAGNAHDVRTGRLDAVVLTEAGRQAEVIFDATRDESRAASDRLSEVMATALPAGCAPIQVKRQDLASKAQLGSYLLAKALPLAVVLMVLLGAFYPAIDVTAGERERGTLETVLSTPVRRFDLLLGKVMAVAVIASITGLVNLGSMTVTLMQALHLADKGAMLPVPWSRAAAAALVVVPAAFLFGALFVAVGALARGFKEAQNYLMPVYFLSIAPALVGAVGEYPLGARTALVPSMNVTLLARDLVLGTARLGPALVALGSTVVYACLALALAARLYDSERLVEPNEKGRRAAPVGDGPPSAGQAMLLYGLAFVLLVFLFVRWQQRDMVQGLLASQWLGWLGLVVLLARMRRQPLRSLVALRPVAPSVLAGAALVGCSAWAAVAIVSEWLVPVPKEVLEQLRRVLLAEGERPFLLNLLLVAVTPAICEEMLFRGVVLRGLATRLQPAAAVVVTGLLFGAFHLDLYRLFPTAVLGVLLSWLALASGSLVPSIVAHMLNNAILVTLATAHIDDHLAKIGTAGSAAIAGGAVVLSAIGLRLVQRGRM